MVNILGGNLDELPEQLNAFANRRCKAHFGDDPKLNFVETT